MFWNVQRSSNGIGASRLILGIEKKVGEKTPTKLKENK